MPLKRNSCLYSNRKDWNRFTFKDVWIASIFFCLEFFGCSALYICEVLFLLFFRNLLSKIIIIYALFNHAIKIAIWYIYSSCLGNLRGWLEWSPTSGWNSDRGRSRVVSCSSQGIEASRTQTDTGSACGWSQPVVHRPDFYHTLQDKSSSLTDVYLGTGQPTLYQHSIREEC